jgi:hypothetical protein
MFIKTPSYTIRTKYSGDELLQLYVKSLYFRKNIAAGFSCAAKYFAINFSSRTQDVCNSQFYGTAFPQTVTA